MRLYVVGVLDRFQGMEMGARLHAIAYCKLVGEGNDGRGV